MSRATIRKAVEWIAAHDAGDDYDGKLTDVDTDTVSTSVGLTAHMFGADPIAVATAVVALRAEARAKAALAALKAPGKVA